MRAARVTAMALLPLVVSLAAPRASAQEQEKLRPPPLVKCFAPAAGVPGETTRVTLEGKFLDGVDGFIASHEGIRATRVEDSDAWELRVSKDVPPGIHELRVHNAHGVSAPRAFHVAATPLVPDGDPKKSEPVAIALDRRVFGVTERNEVEDFTLAVDRACRVVVECLGERIDSQIDASLEILDAAGARVASSLDVIGSDPALAFDAQAGATYTIRLWDLTYQDDMQYVLSVTRGPRVLSAFPPAVPGDGTFVERVTLVGWNLPGGKALEGRRDGLEALEVAAESLRETKSDVITTHRPTSALADGIVELRADVAPESALCLLEANAPVVLESEPNDAPSSSMKLSIPAVCAGRFDSGRDRDWYEFEAKKGERFDIEVCSSRLGFPCDPLLLVARLESAKDGPRLKDLVNAVERTTDIPRDGQIRRMFVISERDPRITWTAPDDGSYLLRVRNRNGRHGALATYALRVRRAAPDFTLWAIPSENQSGAGTTLRRGSAQSYDILLERHGGFEGTVLVGAEGLPVGVTCQRLALGPDDNYGPLVFRASPDASEWTGAVRVAGEARVDGDETIRRAARPAVTVYGLRECRHPLQYSSSRLASTLPLAVRGEAPFDVVIEVPGDAPVRVAPGAKITLPVEVKRRDGFDGSVRIAYQGFNEKGFQNDNGERPAKKTLGKGKAKDEISFTVRNQTSFGRYTFVAFGSAQFEYREKPGDRKSRRQRLWHHAASNPVTIEIVPPVSIAIDEEKLPATKRDGDAVVLEIVQGSKLRIPVTMERVDGVDATVELRLAYEGNRSGLSSETLRLDKKTKAGELVLACAEKSPLEEVRNLRVTSRVNYAGRNHDESVALPFVVRRVAPPREKDAEAVATTKNNAGD